MRFLAGRVLASALVLVLLSLLVFLMVRLIPGDPAAQYFSAGDPDPAQGAEVRAMLGLDQPWPVQYAEWAGRLLTGDFGRSMAQPVDINAMLAERLPVSLTLALVATLFGVLAGVLGGVVSSWRAGSLVDVSIQSLGFFAIAVPGFVLGTLLIALNSFSAQLPIVGFGFFEGQPATQALTLLVPAVLLGLRPAAIICRYTRNTLLDTYGEDFTRTARAKGIGSVRLVTRHSLRNAMIPVTTVTGIELGALVGGTIVIEAVFGLPGIGSMLMSAVNSSDYPTIQAAVLVIGVV
ncbi:ABC transporter permease [Pseudonocardia sp. HH130630-07]|uniref:ABC transporter permease n=1 Tax=Pseudonocardia sp. HH130630-07 TaxID=1690815 RepID=UPI0018D47158|nr:ABC transporter permease [Pseudonocardia sp. HH130630-07]